MTPPDYVDEGGQGWWDAEPIEHPGWHECPLCGSAVTMAGGGDDYDWRGNYGAVPENASCTTCSYHWSEG